MYENDLKTVIAAWNNCCMKYRSCRDVEKNTIKCIAPVQTQKK